MTKISTPIQQIATTGLEQPEVSKYEEIDNSLNEVLQHLNHKKIKAPQKSVDFILRFSKAFRTKRLSNGENVEMLIN